MTEMNLLKCDGCERTVKNTEAFGWFAIQQIVPTRAEYERLVEEANERGYSDAISGDFCSLGCVESWARNAATLKAMEQDG